MTTRGPESLEAKVERLVREYLVEQKLAVKAALERAFAPKAMPMPRERKGSRASSRRRTSTELAGLAERLFEVVKSCPGETMLVIAPRMGLRPRALERAMKRLKAGGRVRSAGERNHTRYFPMTATRAA